MSENKSVHIRESRLDDLKAIKKLVHKTIDASYANVYPKEAIEFFKNYHSDEQIKKDALQGYTVVLELNNKIIGTGTLVGSNVRRVFIDPSYQLKGFGKLIMKNLEKKAYLNGLKTIDLDSSLVSKRFYDSLGYITIKKDVIMVENNQRLDFYKMEKKL